MDESLIKEIKALYASKQRSVPPAAPLGISNPLPNKSKSQPFFHSVIKKLKISKNKKG